MAGYDPKRPRPSDDAGAPPVDAIIDLSGDAGSSAESSAGPQETGVTEPVAPDTRTESGADQQSSPAASEPVSGPAAGSRPAWIPAALAAAAVALVVIWVLRRRR